MADIGPKCPVELRYIPFVTRTCVLPNNHSFSVCSQFVLQDASKVIWFTIGLQIERKLMFRSCDCSIGTNVVKRLVFELCAFTEMTFMRPR